ncbi:MAG: hypothetical protein AAFY26_16625 [Cyanobacteria bacterium J06638_22]
MPIGSFPGNDGLVDRNAPIYQEWIKQTLTLVMGRLVVSDRQGRRFSLGGYVSSA